MILLEWKVLGRPGWGDGPVWHRAQLLPCWTIGHPILEPGSGPQVITESKYQCCLTTAIHVSPSCFAQASNEITCWLVGRKHWNVAEKQEVCMELSFLQTQFRADNSINKYINATWFYVLTSISKSLFFVAFIYYDIKDKKYTKPYRIIIDL